MSPELESFLAAIKEWESARLAMAEYTDMDPELSQVRMAQLDVRDASTKLQRMFENAVCEANHRIGYRTD